VKKLIAGFGPARVQAAVRIREARSPAENLKAQRALRRLRTPSVYICNECVMLCYESISDE
jgi:hypothetical protein